MLKRNGEQLGHFLEQLLIGPDLRSRMYSCIYCSAASATLNISYLVFNSPCSRLVKEVATLRFQGLLRLGLYFRRAHTLRKYTSTLTRNPVCTGVGLEVDSKGLPGTLYTGTVQLSRF